MTKQEFIESYINELEKLVDLYQRQEVDEHAVFDYIQEIRGVFARELPEIDDAIWLRNGTAERDANTLVGILRLSIINSGEQKSPNDNMQFQKELKKLKLEYGGIKATISKYTTDGNITNYLNELEFAISSVDLDSMKYCLSGIDKWYRQNITSIHGNGFCLNKDSHNENQKKVAHFKEVFEGFNSSDIIQSVEIKSRNEPLIFLSHKSDDKKYGDAIRNFIISLGVKNNQLIYSSHPLHKIPLDANIYDYLREHIYSKIFMIILWSDKYLESPACLNEMGAAWVAQSDYTNIYVPTFSFGNPKYHECAIDTRKMGAVLNGDANCKTSMIEIKNKIQVLFDLKDDEQNTQYAIDHFIQEITEGKNND
jgi:hypothetical protein